MAIIGRLLQGTALAVMAVSFITTFPAIMSVKVFLGCIALFIVGWLLQRKVSL